VVVAFSEASRCSIVSDGTRVLTRSVQVSVEEAAWDALVACRRQPSVAS
jgi:hypothetical protein